MGYVILLAIGLVAILLFGLRSFVSKNKRVNKTRGERQREYYESYDERMRKFRE